MPSPFQAARKSASIEARGVQPDATKGTDMTWYGDTGWSNVQGGREDEAPPRTFRDFVKDGFRGNPVVSACIREISTSVSEAPVVAFKKDRDGKLIKVPDHAVEDLFRRPNPRDSYIEFMERLLYGYFLGGNALVEMRRFGSGIPGELYPIRPDRILSADVNQDFVPLRFKISVGDKGATKKLPRDNVIHIPDIDPLNEVFGMPRLLAAMQELQTDNEASNYVNEVLHNHGTPGTVITVDAEKIKRGMIERAEKKWHDKFGPGNGRGRVAFIPGGHQVATLGFSLHDLEFKELRGVTREGICAVFGVDPILVGFSTAARGGTMSGGEHKEARTKLWTQTIVPLMRRWEAAFNAFLAPEFGNIIIGFDTSEIEALQESVKERIERAGKLAETGVVGSREIREHLELDPEMDKKDLIVIRGAVSYSLPENLETVLPAQEPEDTEEDSSSSTETPEVEEE